MKPYRTPQAVITQDHAPSGRKVGPFGDPNFVGGPKTAYVNRYGDPLDYKSNTWVSLLRADHRQPNFTLWPTAVVTHLEARAGRSPRSQPGSERPAGVR